MKKTKAQEWDDAIAKRKARMKSQNNSKLFPKMLRGSYTVRVRFSDESRGEYYFDMEWAIRTPHYVAANARAFKYAGKFTLTFPIDSNGRFINDSASGKSIGKSIRVGDTVSLEITKWNTRGRRFFKSATIKITGVKITDDKFTELTYE